MATEKLGIESDAAQEQVLGFLNFSSGTADPQFFSNINRLFELIENGESNEPTWRVFGDLLGTKLTALKETSPTFRDADQATEFHRDSLFHQTDETLVGPFFWGAFVRLCFAAEPRGTKPIGFRPERSVC